MKITLIVLAVIAAFLAVVEGYEARRDREYRASRAACEAFAQTLFPRGEVDPAAWCEP